MHDPRGRFEPKEVSEKTWTVFHGFVGALFGSGDCPNTPSVPRDLEV